MTQEELIDLIELLKEYLEYAINTHDNIFEPLHYEEVLEDLEVANQVRAKCRN